MCVFQAVSREFICEECQNSTLNKLESMLEILQTDTKQGTVTPTEIADNILNIMGKKEKTSGQTSDIVIYERLYCSKKLVCFSQKLSDLCSKL